MDKRMKTKLIEILRFLIAMSEKPDKSHIPKLKGYIDVLESISVHENDCFSNLPDNMIFGCRGERYLLNTSELTSASSNVSAIIKKLESNNKGGISKSIEKARIAVKHCIDR